MAWTPVRVDSPCPVCGGNRGCAVAEDLHQVWCGGSARRAPLGWAQLYKLGGGKLFNRAGMPVSDEPDPGEAKRADAAARAAGAAWRRGEGGNRGMYLGAPPACLDGCGENHPRARAWLEAQGINVDALAGGCLPASVRYCGFGKRHDPSRDAFEDVPVVMFGAVDRHDRIRGVVQFFLSKSGTPDAIEYGASESWLGSHDERSGGVVIKLVAKAPKTGLLVVALGVLNGLALAGALADAGVEAAVWVAASAKDMRAWRLQPWEVRDVGADGWVSDVLLACDGAPEDATGKVHNEWAHGCASELAAAWGTQVRVRVCEAPRSEGEARTWTWARSVAEVGSERAVEQLLEAATQARLVEQEREEATKPLLLGDTSVDIARDVLEELYHPKEPDGAWTLRYFAGKWWVRRPDGVWEVQDETLLRTELRHHLCRFQVAKGKDLVSYDPSARDLTEILEAMAGYACAQDAAMPQWLAPSLNAHQEAEWSLVVTRGRVTRQGPLPADRVVACADGLLNVDAWIAGKFERISSSSCWFTRSVLPFRLADLPVEYADVLSDGDLGDEDAAEILKEVCPTLHRFLVDIFGGDGQRMRAWAEFAGLCLTSIVKFQTILWCQGIPGTGKGTLVNFTKQIVGMENTVDTDWETLGGRFNSNLVGKSLVVIPELRIDRKSNSSAALSRLLSWSAGDSQSVEAKYRDSQDNIRPTAKWMITPNDDMGLRDPSAALLRRLLIVRAEPRPANAAVDRDLPARLEREVAGGFFLALCGLRSLLRRGHFVQPVKDGHVKGEMLAEMSPVHGFVTEACVLGPCWATSTDELLKYFNEWRKARAPSHHDWSEDALNGNLRATFPTVRCVSLPEPGKMARYWVGIRPLQPLEMPDKPWDAAEAEQGGNRTLYNAWQAYGWPRRDR